MKRITNTLLASFLIILLFIWDLKGSTFNYPSELFIIPWNNQVPFFTFSYLFWLITNDSDEIKSLKVVILNRYYLWFLCRHEGRNDSFYPAYGDNSVCLSKTIIGKTHTLPVSFRYCIRAAAGNQTFYFPINHGKRQE